MEKKYAAEIQLEGQPVPVIAYMERRRGTRFAFTKKGLTLRLPAGLPTAEIQKHLKDMETWVAAVVARKPELKAQLFGSEKTWKTGDILTVGKRQYTLHLIHEERETHAARLEKGTIYLNLSHRASGRPLERAVKTLLSRVVAADFLPEIKNRVLDLNRLHFQKNIRSVNLKYNHTNWGSCSSRSNVNLSTRLLFAPAEVQDYVIIHELAHLLEMNHSDRFWAHVARAMPDFEEKEKWLKRHGKTLDFH